MKDLSVQNELDSIYKILSDYPELKDSKKRNYYLQKGFQNPDFVSILNTDPSFLSESIKLVVPGNKELIYSYIMYMNIDSNVKDILTQFQNDFFIFVPVGAGGDGSNKKPKELSEDEKEKSLVSLKLALLAITILAQFAQPAVDFHSNIIKNKEIEYEHDIQLQKLNIDEKRLNLEIEKLRSIQKELDD